MDNYTFNLIPSDYWISPDIRTDGRTTLLLLYSFAQALNINNFSLVLLSVFIIILYICLYIYIYICMYMYVYNVYMYVYVCIYIYIPVMLIKLLIFYYHRFTYYCSNNRLLVSLIQIKASIIQELSFCLFLCVLI